MSETYHFIGLGGIGMSALARILMQRGVKVAGSDSSGSALLEELRKEGASVRIGHNGEMSGVSQVVYSTAVSSENKDLAQAKRLSLPLLHRSDLLHLLMKDSLPLLVTGTHGKTTTTALLASVLMEAGLDPSFVIGGIDQNLQTNGRAGKGSYFVAEADESDGSFLKTAAFGAIVTNLENDHLDFWKEERLLDQAFGQFFAQAERVFWCGDDVRLRALDTKGVSYGFGLDNDLRVTSEPTETGVRFSIDWDGKQYRDIQLCLFGSHNALNGAAVFGLALSLGVSESSIRKAFLEFKGTARRFEWKGREQAIDVYDDYGHHPTEIRATLRALREKVLERRIVAVFQPHRYSRTRDLFHEFAGSFSDADLVIVTDIYGAGEAPIEGITAEGMGFGTFIPRAELGVSVAKLLQPHDVVMTIGAGDVTGVGGEILEWIGKHPPKLTVGLLFGGTSSEHAVSLMSAETFKESIDRSLYNIKLFGLAKDGAWADGAKLTGEVLQDLIACDVAIPIFHGQQGEDGMIQGLLDTLAIPYVGCDYRSGALCMQKSWTKQIAMVGGIPTSPFVEMDKATYLKHPERLIEKIESYPVWIKPVHLGSSIGITRVLGPEGVDAAAKIAFSFDDALIADKEVVGREIEFSLLGNEYIRVAPAAEVCKTDVFHSYDTKYGAGASRFEIPAKISESERKTGEQLAIEMYRKAGCKGLARIDFFLDEAGQFWMNEINPMPGFTKTSAYPQAWGVEGFSMQKICNELIILAMHRSRQLIQIRGK